MDTTMSELKELKSEIENTISDKSKSLLQQLEDIIKQEDKFKQLQEKLKDQEDDMIRRLYDINNMSDIIDRDTLLSIILTLAHQIQKVASKEYANGYNQMKQDLHMDTKDGLVVDSKNSLDTIFKRFFPSIPKDDFQEKLIFLNKRIKQEDVARYDGYFNFTPEKGQKYRTPIKLKKDIIQQ